MYEIFKCFMMGFSLLNGLVHVLTRFGFADKLSRREEQLATWFATAKMKRDSLLCFLNVHPFKVFKLATRKPLFI